MTTTPHGQVPEALRLAHIFDNPLPPEWPDMVAAAAELRRQHTRIAELEAQIEALSGVQALSAAPVGFVPVAAFDRLHAHAESLAARLLAASPTPTAEQQAQQEAQEPVAWLVTWVGGVHNYVQAHASELPAVDQGRRMAGTVTPLYTAPQPAPAPLSDDALAALDAAIDAAIAAQGGK